jgi:Rrf2 family iron-sulfur cluster assembly transcriptional regulator
MRLTTKGRYAVTAMLDIALHRQHGPISVVDIAERQGISAAYLEQLLAKLKKRGLLASVRGPGGGYRLDEELSSISVSSIITAVGDGVDATRCHGSGDCQDGDMCLTHELWSDLSEEIDSFLTGISLADLVRRKEIQHVASRQDKGLVLKNPLTPEDRRLIQARHL